MNLSNLPLLYLKHVFEYLNSLDQINLLKAIDQNSEYKNYLFDHKVLNLTNCFKLKANDFKNLSKFYKDFNQIQELNLNFCYHLIWKSVLNQMPKLNFHLLINLNLISIKIEFEAIITLINNNKNLKEISFSINEPINTSDLVCFSTIETIRLELNVQIDKNFVNLLNSFTCIKRLEIFSSKKVNQPKFVFSFNKFKNKFENLTELIVLKSTNIIFEINEINQIVSKLKKYSISFGANVNNWYENIKLNEIKNLSIFINQTIRSDIDNLFENISFNDQLLETLELNKFYNIECILTILPFKLESLSNLTYLDLKYIHLHTGDSLCQLLRQISNLKHLYLPCCALACNEFKQTDTRYLFKRIIEEDEETELKNKLNEPNKKQLEYLVDLKLNSFGLYSPKQHDKAKDKLFYHCRNVDSGELLFIAKFPELKQLNFEGFKFIGTASKFEQFLNDISKSLYLTHFNLIDFNSFITFDYQTRLINQLVNFKYLQELCIDQANFYLTKKLIENISSLNDLKYLKLFTQNEDKNLVKNQTFNSLNKLENLILFDLRCKLTKSDLQLLKKQLKKVLSDIVFISLSKSDQEVLTSRDTQIQDNKSFIQVITISNSSIKYQHDMNVLNFLNEFN